MPTAVVTGSSRGIGRAIALELAARGYRIIVNSRSDLIGGSRVVDEIEHRGGTAAYVKADVSRDIGVADIFDCASSTFGPVTLLVNNAGGTTAAPLGEWNEAHWSEMLNTNLLSVALMSQAFAGQVGEEEGSIVNVGSIRGWPDTHDSSSPPIRQRRQASSTSPRHSLANLHRASPSTPSVSDSSTRNS